MTLIKKIIAWLLSLLRSIFGKKKEEEDSFEFSLFSDKKAKKKGKNKANLNPLPDITLPNYMLLSDRDKEKLLYSLGLMKSTLEEANTKRREKEEKEFYKYLEEKYNIKTKDIKDQKQLDTIISNLDNEAKKEVVKRYQDINKKEEDFKVHLKEVDKVINEIAKNDISIIEENEIENEISDVVNDKDLSDELEEKTDYFNQHLREIISNVDDYFLRDVIREYHKVNYVTVSTTIIDKSVERFKKLEEDFQKHRYNKYYYEREINKIKHELNQIKRLKNKKEVSEHILKLRKELYTKSKDKYDLLYNNEIFMNLDKECDILLDKVNAKVIDIKKEEKTVETTKEDNKDIEKQRYVENILMRFQDMELARKIILLNQKEDSELIKINENAFIEEMYRKYNEGINKGFHFNRNRRKTELVVLFNEINMLISKKKKEPFVSVDHINFRLEDLVEAVEVRKEELNKMTHKENTEEDNIMNEKIQSLIDKPKEKSKTK